MGFLKTLKIDKKEFEEAKESTIYGEFEVLPSGIYDAIINEMVIYKFKGATKDGEKYESTKLRINVKLDESDRVVSFKTDVGKTLKDGSISPGFLARLKSLGVATNFDIDNLQMGDDTKVSSYGKEYEGKVLKGIIGKKVLAMVRKEIDLCKADGEAYREQNFLEGVTYKGSEDIEAFEAKVAKHIDGFEIKCKKKSGSTAAQPEATSASAAELKDADF